ncbi:hypothetical protein IAT38_001959 [Cryptococcus sp. DSM 104549]
MRETIRDSFLGQCLRSIFRPACLSYPEERDKFQAPCDDQMTTPGVESFDLQNHHVLDPVVMQALSDNPNISIVTWYGPDDQENPLNWSLLKKSCVTGLIMFLTITVYLGSAIYAPAVGVAAEYFGVSATASSLGITMFVLGYAVGPLLLSGITEVPFIGRTSPYIITLTIFFVLQILTATVDNFAGFLVLRFLAGFMGSPALATGGASLDDMFVPHRVAYAMGLWELAAEAAPAVAPIISGFAVQHEGWEWAFWEMAILSGVCLIFLIIWLPETSPDTILLRRAQRLRLVTKDNRYQSESEILQGAMSMTEIFKEGLIRPLSMTFTEPIVIAINIYVGIIYATLYSFFESYPMVFQEGYQFSLSISTLPFAAILVGSCLGGITYWIWNYYAIDRPHDPDQPPPAPESRLPLSMYGAFCFPVCILWFAWSANRTHWIVPTLAGIPFGLGSTLIFNPFLTYLPYAYPKYAASALASNDFFRSIMGAAMPVVAHPLFGNLGIDWGNTLIGLISVCMIPIPFILLRAGPGLRKRSPLAT